ncbi:MAG: hypothetical protein HND47_21690 [Chloroflexi bacterium]|nr:hypothetical protein [Chloroflexota bacterium]
MKPILTLLLTLVVLTACSPASTPTSDLLPAANEFTQPASFTPAASTPTASPLATETSTPLPPTASFTPTPIDSLKATVSADRLSCRYGPGPNYLYLFAFKAGANIKLVGRADNDWLLVENEPQRCWIHPDFVTVAGDPRTLRTMYPDGFKLIVSPYYSPTTVLSAERDGDEVTVTWVEVKVSPGKYENPNMFPYIIEVWRCEDGEIIFEPLVSRFPFITFVDEAGCVQASHGRVFVQEKHGYAGPAEIPWPEHSDP